jgi:alpha-1,3-glucosyltransferase
MHLDVPKWKLRWSLAIHRSQRNISVLKICICLADCRGSLCRAYVIFSVAVSYSMHPLLIHPQESPIRMLITLLGGAIACSIPVHVGRKGARRKQEGRIHTWQLLYLVGFALLEVYCMCHERLWQGRMPFVPLMLASLYCSFGIWSAWVRLLREFLAVCVAGEGGQWECPVTVRRHWGPVLQHCTGQVTAA